MEDDRADWRGSIRLRITALAALVVAGVLGFTAVALVALQQRQLAAGLDATLSQRADDIESQAIAGDDAGMLASTGDLDLVAQIVGPDGTVLAAHPVIVEFGPLATAPRVPQRIRTVDDLPIEDDVFRLLSRRLPNGSTLHVASSLDDVRDATRVLIGELAAIVPVATLALAALVWWLVGRTLRPVEAIRAEVERITADQLDRRVPHSGRDDEIGRLATTMNEMLDRIDRAVGAQRRFVGDASHELRNPLTRMRTELETASTTEPAPTLESLHEDVIGMQALVDDLLHLAKSDAGAEATSSELVELDDVVRQEVGRLRPMTSTNVSTSRLDTSVVRGNEAHLERAVRNLLENAARHADTAMDVSVVAGDASIVLTVTDDGPGIHAEDAEAVFERFHRLDAARAAHDGGSGLGLAIVQDIIHREGGSVTLDSSLAQGAAFVVTLPAAHLD